MNLIKFIDPARPGVVHSAEFTNGTPVSSTQRMGPNVRQRKQELLKKGYKLVGKRQLARYGRTSRFVAVRDDYR